MNLYMHRGRWMRWTWLIGLAAMTAVLLLAGSFAEAEDALPVDGTIYYVVTYSDGTIEQRSAPPPTDAGIRSVSRVARYEPELPSYETATTGNEPVEVLNPGRTVTTEMHWNGRLWVAQVTDSPIKRAARRRQAPPRQAAASTLDVRRVADAIEAVNRLGEAIDAARQQLDAADPDAKAKAQLQLTRASNLHQQATAALIALQSQAATPPQPATSAAAAGQDAPRPALPPGLKPTGRITAGKQLPDARDGLPLSDAIGVTRPIAKAGQLNHRVQVWKVPASAEQGRRTVRVAMAHPEAERTGAFRYVAYADTDADGRPDKLLAVSPPAAATEPGGWTSWAFQTNATDIYVGNAWQDAATRVYGQQPTPTQLRRDWRTLDSDVWFSGCLGEDFTGGTYTPWISNIRVHTERPNPDYDVGPRVRIREQE
ncbi:MAG: hypothetical protein GVY16_09565 [Planctomycetes bacterium]|jgi:hypothetical protein|nr:hypothetical protein [Planctomycetota bacterium]